MKAYRDIREKHGLMEMFKNPEIAAQVTLQPVNAFAVDAAIIFADILLPLEGMGINFEFAPGPVFGNPLRSPEAIRLLRISDPDADLGYVLKSLQMVRAEIDGKVPLIGFAGAPFTLASYAIEGGASSQLSSDQAVDVQRSCILGSLDGEVVCNNPGIPESPSRKPGPRSCSSLIRGWDV